jgi:hypothetical protein
VQLHQMDPHVKQPLWLGIAVCLHELGAEALSPVVREQGRMKVEGVRG